MTDFIEQSKAIHSEKEPKPYWRCACVADDNDDTRRHHAMLAIGMELVRPLPISNCLSIGDSRARDAAFAKTFFGCHALASDLNTSQLRQAVQDGFVDEVCDVDVESIPFADASIDLMIAKETFHHWPRPFLGLYEMIRVARQAVLIIEPFDCLPTNPTPYAEEDQYDDSYEEIGNYKYQLSLREVLKAAWAMGLPAVSAMGFNDPYDPQQPFDVWLSRKQALDELGHRGERQFNLMALAIFKNEQSAHLAAQQQLPHGRFYWKPVNPHLQQP
jgi:hypothetical protein